MLRAIERGWVQREIHDAAYRAQKALESKDAIVVGVNEFTGGSDVMDTEILKVDPAVERAQVERLRALRARRDDAAVERALARLAQGARGPENLMPLIIDAVKAYATVGEVCNTLRREWGEYQPPAEA